MNTEKCKYCQGRTSERKPLMKNRQGNYSVVINSCGYLEDSVVGNSVPHSLLGEKLNFCPKCARRLNKCENDYKSVYTFEEFVEHGRQQCVLLYNNMPWSFTIGGYPVTHETDVRYIISANGHLLDFNKGDTLIVDHTGIRVRKNIE